MKKHIILIIMAFATHMMWAQAVYEKKDSVTIVELLQKVQRQRSNACLPLYFAHQLMGRPYVGHTLEGQKTERLVVNTRQLDCTTLVETVTALTLCAQKRQTSFADYLHMLTLIRYRGGQLNGYTSRLHYFTDWILDNESLKIVEDVAVKGAPFTAIQTVRISYMSQHPTAYAALKSNKKNVEKIAQQEKNLTGRKFRYIPKGNIVNTKLLRNAVKNGDIIAIVTNKKGLDIAHVGFAEWQADGLHLLNASSIHKQVVLESMTLLQYMKKHPSFLGIRVVRIKK